MQLVRTIGNSTNIASMSPVKVVRLSDTDVFVLIQAMHLSVCANSACLKCLANNNIE